MHKRRSIFRQTSRRNTWLRKQMASLGRPKKKCWPYTVLTKRLEHRLGRCLRSWWMSTPPQAYTLLNPSNMKPYIEPCTGVKLRRAYNIKVKPLGQNRIYAHLQDLFIRQWNLIRIPGSTVPWADGDIAPLSPQLFESRLSLDLKVGVHLEMDAEYHLVDVGVRIMNSICICVTV